MQDDQATLFQRHRISTASGVPLSYADYVPPGEIQSNVVLVHGLASSGQQFHEDALRFARGGYRVIVPDLRGHGLSGVPKEPLTLADFSIPVMARDVLDILDHAGVQAVHWVGNSLGGILALWLLGTLESRRLRSLTLFGTCFSMNLPAPVSQVLRLSFLPGVSVTAWVTARMTTSSSVGQRSIAAAIRQFNVDAGAAIAANVRRYDFVANALRYDRPMLVLWGGKDRAVNLGLRRDIGKFAGRPNFRRIDFPEGGHCSNLDMPDEFVAALEQHWIAAEQHDVVRAVQHP